MVLLPSGLVHQTPLRRPKTRLRLAGFRQLELPGACNERIHNCFLITIILFHRDPVSWCASEHYARTGTERRWKSYPTHA